MSAKFAHFVSRKKHIQSQLLFDFEKAGKKSGLVVIIFANPEEAFTKEKLIPLIPHWNFRSKHHVAFFFVGFTGQPSVKDPETSPGNPIKPPFNARVFNQAIDDFERACNWEYRGDTPLIICRGYLKTTKKGQSPKAYLDLDTVIEFQLEQALKKEAIQSVKSFFELIIKTAKETKGDKVHWKLSDVLGGQALGAGIIDFIVSKLPGVNKAVDATKFFRLKKTT